MSKNELVTKQELELLLPFNQLVIKSKKEFEHFNFNFNINVENLRRVDKLGYFFVKILLKKIYFFFLSMIKD